MTQVQVRDCTLCPSVHRGVQKNLVLFSLCAAISFGESGADAWLRYARLDDGRLRIARESLPAVIALAGNSLPVHSAQTEIIRGVRGMTDRVLRVESGMPAESAIVLGTIAEFSKAAPQWALTADLIEDAFWLKTIRSGGRKYTVVTAANDRGVLYGSFELLRRIALGESLTDLNEQQSPYAPVRWTNEWNNLDGTIERGYGGRSIFFEGGHVRDDLSRVSEYGRLLASAGINACAINNVNANPRILDSAMLPQLARIADAFRPWGVQVVLSVDLSSPKTLGGLETFDPLDAGVVRWWQSKVDELYRTIPTLGGFIMKADSEGRAGPSTYHRTHADAANVVARALKPHGGLIFYRGFVYDHHADWRNLKNDRARAAYDNFHELDGKFEDNAVVQIKHGPIDFQVREPASPLTAALKKTNQAIELQITQEYFGQARHLVFLVPMWKETLDFDMHVGEAATPVKALSAGKVFHRPVGGFVGVSNVGLDENWFGNHLSQANLYGFGRLAWNPDLTAQRIAEEWTRLTFGSDPKVVGTVAAMQMKSWRTYENYTGSLGLQTLTDITGNHYGVSVEASERNGWGQWHRSDEHGAGMDRTVATGTGYVGQYPPKVAHLFESLETCPDDLVLFFHHVPYTHRLNSGKSVIQFIYDAHYEGAEAAAGYVTQWQSLSDRVDERRYREVLAQLEYQAGQAQVWRDAVTNWYARASGITDAKGRVGHYPGRVEAEKMKLESYTETPVTPWEAGSGGKAVECAAAKCNASFAFRGSPGWYTIRVQYFDQNNGVSQFRVWVGQQTVDHWDANDNIPSKKLDGSTSSRRSIRGIALRDGDEIRIEGTPGGDERAAFDYVEVVPDGR